MEISMKTANYNRFIDFMAKLESTATTAKERDVINSARGMFAKFEGTAATMDVNMAAKSRSPEFGMMSHNGPKTKPMTQAEKDAFNADVSARNKQWKKQVGGLKRRGKTAERTLEEYAGIAPGELDAWVENTLRPTIEEYLDSEEGGLVWADENKKTVKRERGAGGFITPAMKRAKYEDDKKAYIDQIKAKKAKEEEAKKAKEAEAAKAQEAEAKGDEAKEAPKDEQKGEPEKKKGLFSSMKAKLFGESVDASELRSCFESVFGNSEHLSDEAIRAICYNAVERKFR
jgi:hypothetical protein